MSPTPLPLECLRYIAAPMVPDLFQLRNILTLPYLLQVNQSDLPFRLLCRTYGATLTCTMLLISQERSFSKLVETLDTQMFLAEELLFDAPYQNSVLRDLELGSTIALGRPLVVQLAGNNPAQLVKAGKLVQAYCDAIGAVFRIRDFQRLIYVCWKI